MFATPAEKRHVSGLADASAVTNLGRRRAWTDPKLLNLGRETHL